MNVLRHIVKKEFRQIFRQRQIVGMIFIMPIVQLVLIGYAINLEVKHIRLAFVDRDHSENSRNILSRFRSSKYFDLVSLDENADLQMLLDKGKIDIAVVIPDDFTKNLGSGNTAQGQILVDAQNSNLASIAAGYVSGVFSTFQDDYRNDMLRKNPELKSKVHMVDAVTRVFYNPEMNTYYYMIPGIAVMLLTMVTMLLNALNIVREKEIGTFEQLMVTPIRRYQFIIGKSLPFAILGFIELFIALAVGMLWFKIPFSGSILLLAFTAALFLMTTLGAGLLVTTVSNTQQQTLFTSWFFLVFCMLMSGYFTPIENMPAFFRYLTYLDPLTYFMRVVRGIFLKGSGFFDLQFDIAAMAIFGVLMFTLAILRFHKTTS